MARDDRTDRDLIALTPDLISGEDPVADAGRLNDAAIWHARLRKDAQAESTWIEFAAWLEADGNNRVVFDLVEDLYFALEEAEPHLTPAIEVTPRPNVVGFPGWRRARLPLGAAAGLALAASLAIAIVAPPGGFAVHEDHYTTAIGEKRTVTLSDGSVIEMNTASAVTVAFDRTQRKVSLDRGEALFNVGKDPSRPFLVTVGDRDVRDIGTIFDILSDSGRIVVTVADGEVAVSNRGAAGVATRSSPVNLVAGDQLMIQQGRPDSVRQTDPATATAWREGYLTYKEAPLSLVVSDLNRYFPNRIVLRDSDTGLRRFSGALKIDSEDAVVSRLAELLPLTVDRADDGVITLRLKPQKD